MWSPHMLGIRPSNNTETETVTDLLVRWNIDVHIQGR
jgi:hypothetical protein